NDSPMLVERHRLRLRRIVVGADPHVQHAFDRRHKRNALAIRAKPHPRFLWIAKERLPRDQRDVIWPGGQGHGIDAEERKAQHKFYQWPGAWIRHHLRGSESSKVSAFM